MKTADWIRALAVTALMASACSSAPPVGNAPSPSASASASPSATASPNPTPAPIRNLALVTLRGSDSLVVRDVTDINHPRTIGNLGPNLQPQFVSAETVSYVDAKRGLVRTPLSGAPRTPIAGGAKGFFTWSPDGKTAAYLSSGATGSRPPMHLHLVSGGKDRIVNTMPGLPAVFGCESQACGDGWDFHLSYSPDGGFITWAQSVTDVFRMWTAAGVDVTPSTPFVNMSVWSGASLYFNDSKDVKVWRNGVVSTFLPGVAWIRPKASPGGSQIVYETRNAAGVSRTYVVDTVTAKVRQLGGTYRAEPTFLTARFIWYKGERYCNLNECFAGSALPTGKTYIYDLQTGTETESIITGVADVWPHPA
jgi:WD40-like Beta Propeller Repeat